MTIATNCEALIAEIKRFSAELLFLGAPIVDARLEIFELQIQYLLPDDFKYILTRHNKLSLMGIEVCGLDAAYGEGSLDRVYHFETRLAANKAPAHFLPFSPDGFGNHYCLNLSEIKNGLCPVVFWQHDVFYEDPNDAEVCNDSFMNWVEEVMIEWTLNDYNYDGSEK